MLPNINKAKKEETINFNKDKLIKEEKIIFKKYKKIKKIYSSFSSKIYLGINLINNNCIILKTKPNSVSNQLLENEAYCLYNLKGFGIPKLLSYGNSGKYNILVEQFLGKSLNNIFKKRKFSLKDICLISIQMIERIRWVHNKYYIHRDIEPDNFLIGNEDQSIIYLIDFGLSQKYRSSRTGKHIECTLRRNLRKFEGTADFASVNALRCRLQSRKDDLESIGYIILYFMRGKLPWQVNTDKKKDRYIKTCLKQKSVSPKILCKGLPIQIMEYIKYIKQLKFEQDPDYDYLINLFKAILEGINCKDLIFSWIHFSSRINNINFEYKTPRKGSHDLSDNKCKLKLATKNSNNSRSLDDILKNLK